MAAWPCMLPNNTFSSEGTCLANDQEDGVSSKEDLIKVVGVVVLWSQLVLECSAEAGEEAAAVAGFCDGQNFTQADIAKANATLTKFGHADWFFGELPFVSPTSSSFAALARTQRGHSSR